MKNLAGTGLVLLSILTACETPPSATAGTEEAIVESPRAALAIDAVARIFPILGRAAPARLEVASRGARADSRDLLPGLRVSLPECATGALRLSDGSSGVEIGVTLDAAERSELEIGRGFAWFANALGPGRNVLMKARPDGVEDYVHFAERPALERITYRVDVSRVHGVRFVEHVVEFLDAGGVPQLRMAPPYVFGKLGAVRPRVLVDGCAYDSDLRPPWDRPITPPRSNSCTIALEWSDLGVDYPALVDPVWSSAGVMSVERTSAAAAIVESAGKKYGVVTGGFDSTSVLSSAEVFDSVTLKWTTIASMAQARLAHTATQMFASPASSLGQVVVAGGASSSAELTSVERWEYASPTGAWTPLPGLTHARLEHAAAYFKIGTLTPHGAILFTGGRTNGYEWVTTGEMLWSDQSGALKMDANGFTAPRAQHTALTVSTAPDLAYVWSIGGIAPNAGSVAPTNTTEFHNYGASPGPFLARARAFPGAALISGDRAVVAGGEEGVLNSQTVEVVSSDFTGSTVIGTLCVSCSNKSSSATKLPNGSVLVAGGKADQAWVADPDQPVMLLPLPKMPTQRNAPLALGFDDFVAVFAGSASPATATDVFRLLQNGDSCQNGAECGSKHCVAGVCCDTACNAACQACSATTKQDGSIDGVCGNAKAGTDPGDQCLAQPADSCATTGVCSAAGVCALHQQSTPCGEYACSGSTLNTSQCDGVGNCDGVPIDCSPYTCGLDGKCGGKCPCVSGFFCTQNTCVPQQNDGTGCIVDEQCASGFCVDGFCCNTACDGKCEACDLTDHRGECWAVTTSDGDAAPGECLAVATCLEDNAALSADKKKTFCAPYRCQGGACPKTCASVNDCVGGAICNSEHACVIPDSASEDESVCACRGAGRPSNGHAGILLLILGSLFLGRRTSSRLLGRSTPTRAHRAQGFA